MNEAPRWERFCFFTGDGAQETRRRIPDGGKFGQFFPFFMRQKVTFWAFRAPPERWKKLFDLCPFSLSCQKVPENETRRGTQRLWLQHINCGFIITILWICVIFVSFVRAPVSVTRPSYMKSMMCNVLFFQRTFTQCVERCLQTLVQIKFRIKAKGCSVLLPLVYYFFNC